MADVSEIKTALKVVGYKEDRFGHMKKPTTFSDGEKGELRVKFQKISVRLEARKTGLWHKRSSAYLKDVQITEFGGIIIGNKRIKGLGEIVKD